jgi:hypothetical protein
MIELLLQAERALAMGLVDRAERLYAQAAAADPRNSIAIVGLARVALERTDDAEAYRLARQALVIDPENAAAARLVGRLEEVYAARGLPVPEATVDLRVPEATVDLPPPDPVEAPVPDPVEAPVPTPVAGTAPSPAEPPAAEPPAAEPPRPGPAVGPPRPAAPPAATPSPARRSILDRLLRRNRP